MIDRDFQIVPTNGVDLRCAIAGDGPLVILLHGWPQCWYLWRHQIDPISAAGYRVVVPDQRGYGGSSKPEPLEAYNIRALSDDVVGLARTLGYEEFIVIGQDWGCVVAWHTALWHPQTCRAVMGLSVPFWRMSEKTLHPTGFDDRFWYMRYFQTPGLAEAELEADLADSLRRIYYTMSADSPRGIWMAQLNHPREAKLLDVLPPPGSFSSWLTDDDFEYYLAQYRRSGFRGPCNWYRNIAANGILAQELETARFRQPAAFLAGAEDDVLLYDPKWQEHFPNDFDDLRFVELVPNAGHWVQAEQPALTTALIVRFLRDVTA